MLSSSSFTENIVMDYSKWLYFGCYEAMPLFIDIAALAGGGKPSREHCTPLGISKTRLTVFTRHHSDPAGGRLESFAEGYGNINSCCDVGVLVVHMPQC
jgi:hypothetical protein